MKRLRALFARHRLEKELEAELAFHLERQVEENRRRGMSEAEAHRAALLSFGGVEQVKEACRDGWVARSLEVLVEDVRFGLRQLARSPGFATVVVLTLALGIGANTAVFSVLYGVLFRPLPYARANELVIVRQQMPKAEAPDIGFSDQELQDFKRESRSFSSLVEYHQMAFVLLGRGEPERVDTGVVSADFFDVLGVTPLLGRSFRSEDETMEAEPVLLLANAYWKQRFDSDREVVGRLVKMNDRPHRIVGVLPPLPPYPKNAVYMPTTSCPFRSAASFKADRGRRLMSVYGRLKPGVGLDEAQVELAGIGAKLKERYPETYPAATGYRVDLEPLHLELTRTARPTLFLLVGIAALVLLSACANVANLSLARLLRREPEMAMRLALGAGRVRVLRQLLTESTLLALAGGALGLLGARAVLELLVAYATRLTPRAAEIDLNGVVLLFTLVLSVLTGVFFGALPVWRVKDRLFSVAARGENLGPGRRPRFGTGLIVTQVAVSFVLLIAAGLLSRSLLKLHQVDPGFQTENVVTMRVSLSFSTYRTHESVRNFFDELLQRVESQPGVLSAAVVSSVPLQRSWLLIERLEIEGRPAAADELPLVNVHMGSTGYFETLGLPLLAGRSFCDEDDAASRPVAILNETLARRYWDKRDPLGERISLDGGKSWVTVVGLVSNTKHHRLDEDPPEILYLPFKQHPEYASSFLVRTTADPKRAAEGVRSAAAAIDPEQPVDEVLTLDEIRRESLSSPSLIATLLGLFAGLAVLITASGIAGVVATSVSARRHELGIRLALGARPGTVLFLVLRQGMGLALVGLGLGIVGALPLGKLLSSLLYAVTPTDPATFLAVSLMLVGVAAFASVAPARRAAHIDPLSTLRSE